ncbi:MAG TPA: acetyl-CoA carboxylase biotin carboxylase subunit [Chloroflexi bacterium]|nr:acetyl-CoA carboxylase biotin carboxylase subunit [Chloroflexota bacterium]HHW85082.1 acetyl-CoA carboxylase biotin carboxylase subunit [Chloroflexota bacterium]
MFRKILIANRGEIAVRIIRACQEMGIATVAVYSEADARALHVALADEAALIGPPSPRDSYLRGDRILEVARARGCEAIHPGYGFLAENADFADAVTAANIVFIGPSGEAIRTMGSKTAARAAMQTAGVPIVPGYQASQADADLIAAADVIGYPVLVKATAGGGGKGMRVIDRPGDLPHALESARREGFNAFGDERIYLEKLIEHPHHIEFQVFGDYYGNVVHLFERECSVQRRHQKIIEETPSPLLDADLRARMGAAAVAAVRAVGYTNAGTVEFLVDAQRNFYFLEMNTRLQVEHPITEVVTGVDLVKLQIRVAAGEPLPFTQAELSQRGHAIECRIYAEDPANHFLPAIGKVLTAVEPVGPGVRVDAGVTTGDAVTLDYDPMIAKLIVLGENRRDAIGKMQWALRHYVILGDVITNIAFLRTVLAHPRFLAGDTTTDFVDAEFGEGHGARREGREGETESETERERDQGMGGGIISNRQSLDLAFAIVALAETLQAAPMPLTGAGAAEGDPFSPWQRGNGFRLGETKGQKE